MIEDKQYEYIVEYHINCMYELIKERF